MSRRRWGPSAGRRSFAQPWWLIASQTRRAWSNTPSAPDRLWLQHSAAVRFRHSCAYMVATSRADRSQQQRTNPYRVGVLRTLVCTENSILVAYATESPNVSGDDRSIMCPPSALVRQPPQLRKPAPRRASLDLPIAQPDMLDDRRRDHVALDVCQGFVGACRP